MRGLLQVFIELIVFVVGPAHDHALKGGHDHLGQKERSLQVGHVAGRKTVQDQCVEGGPQTAILAGVGGFDRTDARHLLNQLAMAGAAMSGHVGGAAKCVEESLAGAARLLARLPD